MMKFFSSVSKSKVVRVIAAALILASSVSFINLTLAADPVVLTVRVYENEPSNNKLVAGVNVRIVADDSSSQSATTDNSGVATFSTVPGFYRVELRASGYYDRDYSDLLVDVDTDFVASIMPVQGSGTDGSGGSNSGGGISPDGCTPTPPRGQPLLNIWPIATSGADCTDYPLLSVRNLTSGSGWVSGSNINASAGDTLRVQLYVHNGVLDYPENIAHNVMVKTSLGSTISASAWADNAQLVTSGEKGGNVSVNMPSGGTLDYVAGTSRLFDRNKANERGFSDAVVTSGASLGDMRGCFDFLHFVEFDVKVNVPTPPATCIAKATGRVFIDLNGNAVFDSNDQPQANTTVTLLSPDGTQTLATTRTDSNGMYAFNNLTAGRYRVTHVVPGGYVRTTDDSVAFTVCPDFVYNFGYKAVVTTTQEPPAPGVISITKNVRNVTQGQTIFTSSTAANPGEQVEYQIKVSASNGDVINVVLNDTLQSRLNYVSNSLTVNGSPSGNSLTNLSLGNFTSGQTKTVVIRATVADASQFTAGTNTTLVNTATVTSGSNSASATANVIVNVPNTVPGTATVSVTKLVRNVTQGQSSFTKSTTAAPGDILQFQIQVNTFGNTAAQNVVVTDSLPSNLSFVSGSSATNNLGNMNAGSTQSVTLTASLSSENSFACGSTSLTNTVQVTSSNAGNASDNASVSVNRNCNTNNNNVTLSLTKLVRNVTQGQTIFTKSISAQPGDMVQFQIQVTASGNTTANNVIVTDTLPNNFSLVSGNTTSNLGSINSGNTQTILITAQAANESSFPTGTTSWINTAAVNSSNAGSASDTATVIVNRNVPNSTFASLSITKEVRNLTTNTNFSNFTNASVNDQVQFRISVTNTGNGTANNVRVTDNLPSGLINMNGDLVGGTQSIGSLNPGQSRTFTFQATVNSGANQTIINTANASADNTGTVNAQATVYVSAVAGANINLVLSKRAYNQTQNADATVVTARPGDIIIYTLTVRNTGNAAATNFIFQDDISDVLQLAAMQTFDGGAFNIGNLNVSWPSVTIPANGTVEKTFSVKVNSAFPAGSDNVMTNTFGNTVNVRVNKPTVAGAFIAPKTGATSTLAFVFATLFMLGYIGYRKINRKPLLKLT